MQDLPPPGASPDEAWPPYAAAPSGTAGQDAPADPAARRPGRRRWDAVIIVDLVLVGLLALATLLTAVFLLTSDEEIPTSSENVAQVLWVQNAIFLVLFAALPVWWLVQTRVGGWQGAMLYLRLDRPGPGILWGLVAWVGFTAALFIVGIVLSYAWPEATDNPVLEDMGRGITWPLVIATALVAGFGEEIFFRGVLQKWIGVWGQAVAFGLLHASYGTVLQIVMPFALGLAFGYMVRRGMSLWTPITVHVLYDILALGITKMCADNPGMAGCA